MNCKANGCPLSVDFITHWHQNEQGVKSAKPKAGVCWYHRHSEPEHWMRTTERIKQNLMPLVVIRAIKRIDDATFRPRPGELVIDYLDRVERDLNTLIYGKWEDNDADANFAKIIQLLGNHAN